MERFLLLGLVGLNGPLYLLVGWLMFDDLEEFYDGMVFAQDWWTSAKAIAFVITCVALVGVERLLIRWQFGN